MHPVVALLTDGVEMDVLGIAYSEFSDGDRQAIRRRVSPHPSTLRRHQKDELTVNVMSRQSRRNGQRVIHTLPTFRFTAEAWVTRWPVVQWLCKKKKRQCLG